MGGAISHSSTTAFNAGIRHAAEMAQLAALQIELRPDGGHIRRRAAIEALRGLAEGLKDSLTKDAAPCTQPLFPGGPLEPQSAVGTYDQGVIG